MQYNLQYPYSGSQSILIADRVHLHGRKDSVLVLGKKAIGLSSTGTIGIESGNDVTIESRIVNLGRGADNSVILGNDFFNNLNNFLSSINNCANTLTNVPETDLASLAMILVSIGGELKNSSANFSNSLSGSLSQTTYVRK